MGACNFGKLNLEGDQTERSSIDSRAGSESPVKVSSAGRDKDAKAAKSLLDS